MVGGSKRERGVEKGKGGERKGRENGQKKRKCKGGQAIVRGKEK